MLDKAVRWLLAAKVDRIAAADARAAVEFVLGARRKISEDPGAAEGIVEMWAFGLLGACRVPTGVDGNDFRSPVTGEGLSVIQCDEYARGYRRMGTDPGFMARKDSEDPNARYQWSGLTFGATLLHFLNRLRFVETQVKGPLLQRVTAAREVTEEFAREMLEAALDEDLPPAPAFTARA